MRVARRPLPILSALLALVALAFLPAAASASKTQETFFQDDALLLGTGSSIGVQMNALNEIEALGATSIHAIVYWKRHIPGDLDAKRKPRGNSASPKWYPAESWDLLDNLVREAKRRRISLLLTPAAGAVKTKGNRIGLPNWARSRDGSPKMVEVERFVRAVGRRYNGRYRDENDGGGKLPKVKRWSMWNEPNQGGWLQPQWKRVKGKRIPYSPVLYRELYNRGRKALIRSGHSRSKIYLGETAPIGREKTRRNKTAPISPGLFLRELTCLNSKLRSYRRGDAKRRKGCTKYKMIRTHGVNHHFYTKGKGQPATYVPRNRDEFMIGVASRMERLVKRLGAKRRLTRNRKIYNTEFGFQSKPADRFSGVSLSQQAEQQNVAEYLQYKRPGLAAFTHYLMVDDRCVGSRCGGFQTGLKELDGTVKPAYGAFAMPIVVRRYGKRKASRTKVKIWGAHRPGKRGSRVAILANGKLVKTVTVRNKRGYFDTTVKARSNAKFQLVDPTNVALQSRVARMSKSKRVR